MSLILHNKRMNIMMTEKVPTDIRASAVGAVGLLTSIGLAVGYLSVIVGMLILPVWLTCLIVAIPFIACALVLIRRKVAETRGADLNALGGED